MLDDLLVVSCEPQGLDSLPPLGMDAPCVDFSEVSKVSEWKKLHKLVIAEALERQEAGTLNALIYDGMSTADMMWATSFRATDTSARMYGDLKDMHLWFWSTFDKIKVPVVFTFHARSLEKSIDFGDEEQARVEEMRRKATDLAGSASISLQLEGRQSANVYRGQSALFLPVRVQKKGKELERQLLTMPKFGFEAKTRYGTLLNEIEPANLNTLLKKLKDNKGE